eukprot:TRINITY_DN25385_c0_g2_i1.p2 TRINITY_DN25385_c0_g2~~TRINITY_DN25385_c0_g2_i1.p2  ORF type:complete len:199 (-),score=-32.94 TRINITY_DN25385_c0_g2_i1:65-661(-)
MYCHYTNTFVNTIPKQYRYTCIHTYNQKNITQNFNTIYINTTFHIYRNVITSMQRQYWYQYEIMFKYHYSILYVNYYQKNEIQAQYRSQKISYYHYIVLYTNIQVDTVPKIICIERDVRVFAGIIEKISRILYSNNIYRERDIHVFVGKVFQLFFTKTAMLFSYILQYKYIYYRQQYYRYEIMLIFIITIYIQVLLRK